MLAFGYAGETGVINKFLGFACGMLGWFFILFEIFAGESASACENNGVSDAVKQSFSNMRLIVSVGWSIYPLGYVLGCLTGAADETALNVVYNIADLVNKIGFVLSCWSCAKSDSEKGDALLP